MTNGRDNSVTRSDAGRAAVVIAVSEFADNQSAVGGEPTEDPPTWSDLPFASDAAARVASALKLFGYDPRLITAPSGRDIDMTVRETIHSAPHEACVVHVISHGASTRSGKLLVVGADGSATTGASVEDWLTSVEDDDDVGPTLFLLDLCESGSMARLEWQRRLTNDARAWVIAASDVGESAFDGRLTQAVATVLHSAARGRLGIDSSLQHLPLNTIAREIKREVARLSEGRSRQEVIASLLDVASTPTWPFFPNPTASSIPRQAFRASLEASLAPFYDQLDDGLDAWHFVSRASGQESMGGRSRIGLFRGRRAELSQLTRWMDGDEPGASRFVTGSPGVGKSALLGILVCATHPKLRDATMELWGHLPELPSMNPRFAAVHARQRTVQQILDSLARQLGLSRPDAGWTSLAFSGEIVAMESTPTIVIDAVDESEQPEVLFTTLLKPLIGALRRRGDDVEPACAVLVGARSGPLWPEMDAMRRSAQDNNQLIDLDSVPREVLRSDLASYIEDQLRSRAPYDSHRTAPVRHHLATSIAGVLAQEALPEEVHWGEFLVAGLFLNYLLNSAPPLADMRQADELLARVPRTLPEVLDMDLVSRVASAFSVVG